MAFSDAVIKLVIIKGIVLYIIGSSLTCAESNELRFLGLLPTTGRWTGGVQCHQAVKMAIKDINARSDILQNYKLKFDYIDTECTKGISLYRLYDKICKEDPYVMIIGGACSMVSEATAQMTHYWNLTQLSYASLSPLLSDRIQYPNFFRLTVPDQTHNPARIALMKAFNWKKVATISSATNFQSSIIEDFVKRVDDTDITILTQEIFQDDPTLRVQNLKDQDARIIFGAMLEDKARDLICSAYTLGFYGPKIVWVFPNCFTDYFWREDLHNHGCTESEMDIVIEGAFFTVNVDRNIAGTRGIANITATEFEHAYFTNPEYSEEMKRHDSVALLCYDTMWVGASALHCADQIMTATGHFKSIDNFTYADGDIKDIIHDCMKNTVYTGVTGDFMFMSGEPQRLIKIERVQNRKRVLVGFYRHDADQNKLELYHDRIKWKDNAVPRDSTLVTYEEIRIPTVLYVTMTALAVIGICLTLSFIIFNVIYRSNSYVKMSSPNINNILLLGCLLCYSTVFFRTIEVTNDLFCKIRIFLFGMGFTTAFGALFSKTWRVYRIFTNKKLLKFTIKDSQLLAIVVGMVAIVVVVIVAWEAFGPYRLETKYLDKEIYMNGNDAEVRPYVRTCKSDYAMYFSWVLYIIEGGLMAFGAFLAWETRNVKIEALNDSHQIGLCVYNVVILSAVGVMLSLVLDDEEVLMYGVTSGCLIIGTTLTQFVIFIPKIQAVRNKKTGRDQVSSRQVTVDTVQTDIKQ